MFNFLEIIENCIENFGKMVNQGIGWIAEDDVMRQFCEHFPDFENKIFDKEQLKNYVIDNLSFYTEVRKFNNIDNIED